VLELALFGLQFGLYFEIAEATLDVDLVVLAIFV